MNNLPKIIIDTDPGHDDALAIILLVKSRLFNILAVTTVAGNSTIQNVTNNARYILDLLKSDIPIYSGSRKPLARPLVLANVHGQSGLDGAEITKTEKLTNSAVSQIINLVRRYPNQVSIITIGPETNLAKAFTQDPQLSQLVKQIIIMGGAISVPGNKNRVAEFNIFVDPKAADIVFSSSTPKILIPLDVCNNLPLFLNDFKKLKGSSLYHPIMKLMKKYIKGIKKFENTSGALMYDPLAAYYLINPSAYTTCLLDVRIETKGELTLGMTVADKRNWGDQKPNISVVTKINRNDFVKDFIKILKT